MTDGAKILAIGGFAAGLCGMIGGFITPQHPALGPYLIGTANVIMLCTNLWVGVRRVILGFWSTSSEPSDDERR